MPFSRHLFFLLALLWTGSACAQGLYSGTVLVEGHGVDERGQAVPAALIQVLQKLSGQRELPTGPAMDAALLSANRIMVSSYYDDRRRVAPDGSISDELWLVVNFLPAAVDRIVRDLELSRWRQERQPVTIWIVVDDGLGRRAMPVEYGYAWDAMADIASMRGLPVTWPDYGAASEQPVDLQLLWGGFTEQLIDPAAPGGGALIVAARRAGPQWEIRWTFSSGEETTGWRNRGRDLSFALAEGLHRLTDLVAARHSIAAAGPGNWRLGMNVSGIGNALDYERCLAYLEGLSLVNKVNIAEVMPGTVRFLLELNASPEYLAETFDRDLVLERGVLENEYQLLPE